MELKEYLISFCEIFYTLLKSIISCFIPLRWRIKDVSNDIVLITGASSGIGRQLSYAFAKKGCVLILWDINESDSIETAKECIALGASVHSYKCDLSKREEIYQIVERVKIEVGKVDILINNAGVVSGQQFVNIPDEMIELTVRVNTMAHLWTIKSFLPDMLKDNHGHIVTIASMAGKTGTPGLVDYCASKFGVVGLTSALRTELYHQGKMGVHTTCVCPGIVNTGLFSGLEDSFICKYITPPLNPQYVASKIVQAVLTNQHELVLPRIGYLSVIMEAILPIKTFLIIGKLTKSINLMDSFKGRAKNE